MFHQLGIAEERIRRSFQIQSCKPRKQLCHMVKKYPLHILSDLFGPRKIHLKCLKEQYIGQDGRSVEVSTLWN